MDMSKLGPGIERRRQFILKLMEQREARGFHGARPLERMTRPPVHNPREVSQHDAFAIYRAAW